MKAAAIALPLVLVLLSPSAPARAAEISLGVQLQLLCLPFAEGRRTLEDSIARAQRTGYPERVSDGSFHALSGPAGKLRYVAMPDGRRVCEFQRPRSDYRQVLADAKALTGRVAGGPWVLTTPEGPDVDGKRVAGWTGANAIVGITEDFADDGDLVLLLEARSKTVR